MLYNMDANEMMIAIIVGIIITMFIMICGIIQITCGCRESLNDRGNVKFDRSGTLHDDTSLELYPQTEYEGWDLNGYNEIVEMYRQDVSWHRSYDLNIKFVPFMYQINGTKYFKFQSWKVNPGTYLMLTCEREAGVKSSIIFVIGGYNIRNVHGFLKAYPEIGMGDQGLRLDNWGLSDYVCKIGVIGKHEFERQKLLKYDNCIIRYINVGKGQQYADTRCDWSGVV
jgi:hypothetical protein